MMNEQDLSLDFLLQETLAMTDYLQSQNKIENKSIESVKEEVKNDDYFYDLADAVLDRDKKNDLNCASLNSVAEIYPATPGIIYKIDNGVSTFCIRGFSVLNIKEAMRELSSPDNTKALVLKLNTIDELKNLKFFSTQTFELAETIRDQVINRRFPHQEDAVCNISDPGFSWWMSIHETETIGRFEIFFRSHSINRVENCIQLGPIGDKEVAALRLNQARNLLSGSFPLSEYSCDEKSFVVETSKPDHSSFNSFMNIFKNGENRTTLENFPDTNLGKTLFYYFHELAVVRKFWIEVKNNLC